MMKHPNVHKLTLIENRISDKLNVYYTMNYLFHFI